MTFQRAFLAVLGLLFVGSIEPAFAFDTTRCDNDNDPVPPFAKGRQIGTGCLEIEDGLGNVVLFDHEANADGESTPPVDCSTADCAEVLWGYTIDDYLHASASAGVSGADALQITTHYRDVILKDMHLGNTWACEETGSSGWDPPAGAHADVFCEDNNGDPHTDALQIRGTPVGNGTFIAQDSEFVNSNHQHILIEHHNEFGGTHPMFVFQNVFVGYKDVFGIATDWPQDCLDSGAMGGCGTNGRWQVGSNSSTHYARATWLINSRTTAPINPNRTQVIVVVNGGMGGGCDNDDVDSCDGTIGFSTGNASGWVAPLGRWQETSTSQDGPGTCPNGRIAADVHGGDSTVVVPVYCFTSIDAALAAPYHATTCPNCPLERPKYIQLSNSGWLDSDSDGIPDFKDNCDVTANSNQADTDSDGVGNVCDNCIADAQDETQRCDTDEDGYGNYCDGDFDNDGYTIPFDFDIFNDDFTETGEDSGVGTDMDCDGDVIPFDFDLFNTQLITTGEPGPSGLSCAGSVPCAP